MNWLLILFIASLGLGLYFWSNPKPSGVCPDSNLCFDCNLFRSYGSSAFSTTEKGVILPIEEAFEVCKQKKECVGILSSGKEGMLLSRTPSNSGTRNNSVYFEKIM